MPPRPTPPTDSYGFLAIVTWDKGDDEAARSRLLPLFETLPEGIPKDSFQGYYLTGERKMIFIGQTDSAKTLQVFSSNIIYGAKIDVKFYHCVEIHEMAQIYQEQPDPG